MFVFFWRLLGLRQQRVRLDTSIATRLRRSALVLALLLLGHTVAITILEPQILEHGMFSALWLTLTTVITVGYGDVSAATVPGQIATIVFIYTAAVFIVANVASLAVELRLDRINRMRAGTWRWNLRDHMLIVNSPATGAERYFVGLLKELRLDPQFSDIPVMILTDRFSDGLPESVHDLGAVYYQGSPHDSEALKAAGVESARFILLLADDPHHPRSDSLNFDILLEIHELYTGAKIIAEVVDKASRERFRRFGAHRLIRPARVYPELMVRAVTCPGSEILFEDMLHADGSPAHRYNVRIRDQRWADVVSALLQAGFGTALAYVNESRRVVSNPPPHEVVNGRGIIMLSQTAPSRVAVQDVIESLASVG